MLIAETAMCIKSELIDITVKVEQVSSQEFVVTIEGTDLRMANRFDNLDDAMDTYKSADIAYVLALCGE
jgi:hypothetical protein